MGSLNCPSYDCFNEEYEFAKTFEIPPFRATLLKPRPFISGFLCTFADQARNPLAARKTLRQAACPHDQVDRQQNGLAVLPAPVGGDLDWWLGHVGKSQRIIIPGMMEHIS